MTELLEVFDPDEAEVLRQPTLGARRKVSAIDWTDVVEMQRETAASGS
jgi:hypothetical protein